MPLTRQEALAQHNTTHQTTYFSEKPVWHCNNGY